MHSRILLFTFILLCPAFAATGVQKKFSGKYRTAMEMSAFYPDGLKEKWWADVAYLEEMKMEEDRCYKNVVFNGTVTPKGRYGHMGAYDRELRVNEVLKFTRIDCKNF